MSGEQPCSDFDRMRNIEETAMIRHHSILNLSGGIQIVIYLHNYPLKIDTNYMHGK